MANIVISWHNQLLFANENARPPFYQAFIDGLKKAGNNILLYENSTFMKNEKNKIPEKYLAQIKKFNPDLFIFFNNQFWDISDTFKDTPMVIYDVDSPNVFNNVDLLKENPNRYLYLTIQTGNREILHDILGCDLKRTQYIPPFTNIQREKCKQDINIAFCGSPWLFNDYNDFMKFANRKPCRQDRKYALMVFEEFKKNPQMSPVEIYSKLNIVPKKHYLEFKNQQITAARIAGSRRCKILSEISSKVMS